MQSIIIRKLAFSVAATLGFISGCRPPEPKRLRSESNVASAITSYQSKANSPKQYPTPVLLNWKKNAKITKTIRPDALVDYDLTLNDVESGVEAVVVGHPTQALLDRQSYVTYFPREILDRDPNQYVDEEWIVGNFQVDQVLYSKPGSTSNIGAGQSISLIEPVGLRPVNGGVARFITEDCTELKNNSRYVVFVSKNSDGSLCTVNLNLGRFNLDATDPEDEIGGGYYNGQPTDKQKLRDEIAARYSVTFNLLPTPQIISVEQSQIYSYPANGYVPSTKVTLAYSADMQGGTFSVERPDANGQWQQYASYRANTGTLQLYPQLPSGTNLRVIFKRRTPDNTAWLTSNYSVTAQVP